MTRTKAEAREQSASAMLEAGMQILREMPVGNILSQVKAAEVANRAGKTTGAFYNIWKRQADYHRDLIKYTLSHDRFTADAETVQDIVRYMEQPELDLAGLIRTAANTNFEGLKDDPAMSLQMALWSKHQVDDYLCEEVRNLYKSLHETFQPFYSEIFNKSGRRMRPPYTIHTITVVLIALVEGLHMREAVDPEAVPDDFGSPPEASHDEERWGMFAAVAYTLVMAMTETKK
jgi:hypothetical protein